MINIQPIQYLKLLCWTFLFLLLSNKSPAQSEEIDFSFKNSSLSIEQRAEILVAQMTNEEKILQLMNSAPSIPRLDVPEYNWWNEALHGVARNGKATIFPQAIALGASFDPELAERVASAISTEAVAKYIISQKYGNRSKYAGLTFWTPNVNIFRDPRWGRGQETYGEDPCLTSKIGVAFVNGLQGQDEVYLKTAACAKHFAVHSGPEEFRHTFNAEPSPKDLHETSLPAFKALVTEANVEGVMGAYNAVNGEPSCANSFLLQDILRNEWGFDGYITSDCGAIHGIYERMKFAGDPAEASALALKAGTNLNCGGTYEHLKEALEQGLISEDLLHERTVQLFKTRFRLGMFDEDKNYLYSHAEENVIHSEQHVQLAREAARKSIVLLKNKNDVLPLSKEIKVPYVTGPFANSSDMLMGNYYGVSPNLVTILEGISDAVSLGTSLNYRSGALPFQKNINPKNWAPFVAGESDVTICVVGITADMEGEEVDAIASENIGDRKTLALPENQVSYIHELIKHKKGPLILVVASGSPVSLEGIEEHCDAILHIWYPGEQGGHAVADILFGDVSPSGRLPITFPKSIDQLPPYEDYSMQGRTYKFMTKEPLFPFGFGLSYTSFEYADLEISNTKLSKKDPLSLSCSVSNTGKSNSDEIVQLYLAPVDEDPLTAEFILLRFQRISLEAGQKATVSLQLNPEDLEMVNESGEKEWKKGRYKIIVSNALPSQRSLELGAAIPLEREIVLK